MKKLTSAVVVAAAAVGALQLSACGGSGSDTAAGGEPADVTPVKGTNLSDVKLTAQAARRVGIRTAAVEQLPDRGGGGGRAREAIPYSAVLYGPDGATYAYTSPRPLVFRRARIRVADIRGDRALLAAGPPVGTAVVTVGAPELYGTEFGVEE